MAQMPSPVSIVVALVVGFLVIFSGGKPQIYALAGLGLG